MKPQTNRLNPGTRPTPIEAQIIVVNGNNNVIAGKDLDRGNSPLLTAYLDIIHLQAEIILSQQAQLNQLAAIIQSDHASTK